MLDDIETPVGRVSETLGGSAAYAALAARHFAETALASIIGRDFPGRYLETLRGVDLSRVRQVPGRSFRWVAEHHADGTTLLKLNDPGGTAGILPPLDGSAGAYVLLGGFEPTLQGRARNSLAEPRGVAIDTLRCHLDDGLVSFRSVLASVDLAFLTLEEARVVTEQSTREAIARALFAYGVQVAVLKDGVAGAYVWRGGREIFIPAAQVDVVDPTGAGDAFAGAFVASLVEVGRTDDDTLRLCGLRGAAASSFAVEAFGTQALERATRADLERRANEITLASGATRGATRTGAPTPEAPTPEAEG